MLFIPRYRPHFAWSLEVSTPGPRQGEASKRLATPHRHLTRATPRHVTPGYEARHSSMTNALRMGHNAPRTTITDPLKTSPAAALSQPALRRTEPLLPPPTPDTKPLPLPCGSFFCPPNTPCPLLYLQRRQYMVVVFLEPIVRCNFKLQACEADKDKLH